MDIPLSNGRAPVHFELDDEEYRANYALPKWKGFSSENSREDLTGEHVSFVLHANEGVTCPVENYSAALDWFLEHQSEVQDSALNAIHHFIRDVLLGEYELEDEELESYESISQLRKMVDLSFVRFFPEHKDGLPYFSLEFECNWDPEHGCGVMFHGSEVVETGVSDSAQGAFDIAGHGGAVQ